MKKSPNVGLWEHIFANVENFSTSQIFYEFLTGWWLSWILELWPVPPYKVLRVSVWRSVERYLYSFNVFADAQPAVKALVAECKHSWFALCDWAIYTAYKN